MSAKTNGPSAFMCDSNPGSVVSAAFYERHRALFQELVNVVEQYARERDGNSLILLDASLLGVAQRIRDLLAKQGLRVESAPPTLGDLLSKRMQ